jgi:molybdate transport system regulatory protein
LHQQHQQFLQHLNTNLADDPELRLLLQRQAVKTTAHNQLFGQITAVRTGTVNSEIAVQLKGGERIITTLSQRKVAQLGLAVGDEALLLLNSVDITLINPLNNMQWIGQNLLLGTVIRLQQDSVEAEVILQLHSGETLAVNLTQASLHNLAIELKTQLCAVFHPQAVILGLNNSLKFKE